MVKTLNGWPIVGEPAVTRVFVGGDASGATVLKGPVASAFVWLLQQLHELVEPIHEVHGWRSVSYNLLVGGHPRSDHTSGTAVDVNGDWHPYERHQPGEAYVSGFTAAQVRSVRGILARAPIFEWGLDYRVGLRDAMHFGLKPGTTLADVAAFVSTVRKEDPMATLDQQDRDAILEIVKNGLTQALVAASKPEDGDAGKRGRDVRDALQAVVGSAGEVAATRADVRWLREHGQAGLARLLRAQGVSVATLTAKLAEVGVDAAQAARVARELLDES